jgi:hypothetical protein
MLGDGIAYMVICEQVRQCLHNLRQVMSVYEMLGQVCLG